MYTVWAVRGFVIILPRPPPICKSKALVGPFSRQLGRACHSKKRVATTSVFPRRGSFGFPDDEPTTNQTADPSWLPAVQNYDARSYLNVTPMRKATKLN